MELKKSPLSDGVRGRHLAVLNFLLNLEDELMTSEWFRWCSLTVEIINDTEVEARVILSESKKTLWCYRFMGTGFHDREQNVRLWAQQIGAHGR